MAKEACKKEVMPNFEEEYYRLISEVKILRNKNLELKEIEDAEDKDDMKTSVEEIETAPIITDSKDINNELTSEEEQEDSSLEEEAEEGADL